MGPVTQRCSWDGETRSQSVSQLVSQSVSRDGAGLVPSSMCGGCFPQAEQPAWPQLSKPQALGEDEEEGGSGEGGSGVGGRGGSGAGGRLGKGQTG